MTKLQLFEYCKTRFGIDNCIFISKIGFVPADYYIQIPCGTCYHCQQNKRKYWTFRLLVEMEQHKENTFVTLTFDDENLQKFKGDYKYPLKLYLDRLRKSLGYRPRYWFISELGDEEKFTGRFHLHGIFFGTSKDTLNYALQRMKWPYGISYFGKVQYKTAYYVTKYLLKQSPTDDYKPFIMCSNGIGKSFVNEEEFEKLLNNFDPRSFLEFHGKKFPISPYYRNLFFNDDIKLVNTINRVNAPLLKTYMFRGIEYNSLFQFNQARLSYYEDTLRLGLSIYREKAKSKNIIHCIETPQFINYTKFFNNGKLCFPEG